jgi:hypothetical protein
MEKVRRDEDTTEQVRNLLAYAAMLSEPDPAVVMTPERMEEINKTVFELGHILRRMGL